MIHPEAVVDPKAEVHDSVEIGPFCSVGPNVKIGEGTKLSHNVVVEGHTEIGKNNRLHPFCVVGGPPQDLKYKGEDTKLIIGDNNDIREYVTINLGTVQGGGSTRLGNHNLLMAYVHIGHDCRVGNHCIIANYAGLAGHVFVEDHANLGGMVGISQFARIGAHSYVTGQSGVERDIPRFCIASGSRPIAVRGANIVGLRRAGFDPQQIQVINEVIKLWSREDVPKDRCLIEIETQYGEHQNIQDFVAFIRESKAGVHGKS